MADTANPAPLGLVGFGLTTVLLSSINAGLLPAGGEPVVIPLAMAFGGTAQLIAGIMEFKTGNVFGATAFTAYGAFWWWFALLILLGSNHVLDLSGAGSTIGVCLLLWGVFTFGPVGLDLPAVAAAVRHLPDALDRLLPAGRRRGAGQSRPCICWAAGSACSAGRWPCMAASPWSPTRPMAGKSCRSGTANVSGRIGISGTENARLI